MSARDPNADRRRMAPLRRSATLAPRCPGRVVSPRPLQLYVRANPLGSRLEFPITHDRARPNDTPPYNCRQTAQSRDLHSWPFGERLGALERRRVLPYRLVGPTDPYFR